VAVSYERDTPVWLSRDDQRRQSRCTPFSRRERQPNREKYRTRRAGQIQVFTFFSCRGTSLIRQTPPVGPYSRPMPSRALRWSYGGGAVSYERGTPVPFFHRAYPQVKKRARATFQNTRRFTILQHPMAWPFYRTISGVRLYWVLEEPKGPKGRTPPTLQ